MSMEWELIESDDALHAMLDGVADCTVVAIDTEFMRRNTFYPQVALVQLCFGDKAWLVDPLQITDPSPLAQLLVNPAVTKVLHSASEDLEVFGHWLGVLPDPLFDSQRASALLDRGFGLGYRALVQAICDVDLPKGETQSNWLQRPLTESQCEYAAQDVAWLLPVWRDLYQQCEREGKIEWVLADGRDAIQTLATGAGDYFKRIKNGWKLDARQLGILRAVCAWREEVARSRDKPRGWIIDDLACLQLAQYDPRSKEELREVVDLPESALRRNEDALLEVLAAQRARPQESLPMTLPGPLDPKQRKRLKNLKARARQIAEQLGTAPEALLQSKDYELLLRQSESGAGDSPQHWQGWRRELVVEPLRDYLAETI
jgi:ribonuclease D